jgi:hypothetical protein
MQTGDRDAWDDVSALNDVHEAITHSFLHTSKSGTVKFNSPSTWNWIIY